MFRASLPAMEIDTQYIHYSLKVSQILYVQWQWLCEDTAKRLALRHGCGYTANKTWLR